MRYHKMKSSTVTMKLDFLKECERKRSMFIHAQPWQLYLFLRDNKAIQEASKKDKLYLCKKYEGDLSDHVKAMMVLPCDVIGAGHIKELTQKEAIFEFKLIDASMAEEMSRKTLSFDRMLWYALDDAMSVMLGIEFATIIAVPKY